LNCIAGFLNECILITLVYKYIWCKYHTHK
jgi:hypothetical protein